MKSLLFDHHVQGSEAASQLISLRQASQSVAAYSIDFSHFGTGGTSKRSLGFFVRGYQIMLKMNLPSVTSQPFFEESISLESQSSPCSQEEPMQLGRSCLSKRRFLNELCIYCGQSGLFLTAFLSVPKGRSRQWKKAFLLWYTLSHQPLCLSPVVATLLMNVLIDSGGTP